MTVLEKIDNIENAIFDYQIMNIAGNLVNIFTEIIDAGLIEANNQVKLTKLNKIMSDSLSAMQSKDYLLLADKLEYELKPMIGA